MKRRSLILFLAFVGCVSPTLVTHDISPQINTCKYKTYVFLTPDDQTRLKWLSDPAQRKALEDVLRNVLGNTGLKEADPGTMPDLRVTYSLLGRDMTPQQTTGTVIMASEYRLATLTVDLYDGGARVWRTQLQEVVGDLQDSNLERARQALQKSFADYPPCKPH